MDRHVLDITVEMVDQGQAGAGAQALADALREAEGVLEAGRRKVDPTTMDLGTIVQVVATSGATLALAQGIAAWLRARRGVTLVVERDGNSGSVKAVVEGIDPATAERIVERVREKD